MALVLTVLASGEVLWLLKSAGNRPAAALIYISNFLIVASSGVFQFCPRAAEHCALGPQGWPLCIFALGALAAMIIEIVRYREASSAIANVAVSIFSLFYVGILFSFVVDLRMLGNNVQGILAIVSLIAVVKMCDTGAYTVGRLIGRHKMTPQLSPGKTWEGAVGGLVFAVLGSWAVFELLGLQLNGRASETLAAWQWIAYGVIVGAAGMLGDLAESLLKRSSGRKDSSPWMPGFGGVLDVIDSILFAAPVAYLCWAAGLVR